MVKKKLIKSKSKTREIKNGSLRSMYKQLKVKDKEKIINNILGGIERGEVVLKHEVSFK